jgi:hypothetical protein
VVDISRSVNPKRVATVDTPGQAKGVYVISSFAYVADGTAGLQIVDIRKSVRSRHPEMREVFLSLATLPAWQTLKQAFRSSTSVTPSVRGS